MIEDLQQFSKELGGVPRVKDMNERGPHSRQPYKREFGKWNNALKASGLEVRQEKEYSEDTLIQAINDFAEKLGRRPTKKEMGEEWGISEVAFRTKFGTWGNALERCGYDPNSMKHITSREKIN